MKPGVAACLLLLSCIVLVQGAPSSSDIAAACPNSLSINDPICANGGALHLDDDPGSSLSCANCDCPAEWTGNDCSLCTAAEHCPPKYNEQGQPLQLVGCTSDSMEPSEMEYTTGKSISCTCGGDDKSTQFLCNQQPGTNWDIRLLPSNDTVDWYSGKAVMTVVERSGTPQQNYTPACTSGDHCPTAERYKYAYPQVWKGAFTGCSWSQGDCISPLTGSDCIVFSCNDADVACPPPELPKCPKYTPWGCGKPENESLPYWSHHCIPSSYPQAGKSVTLACKQRPDNGTYQCYIAQEGASVASLGMKCRTGTCIYNDTALPPAPPHPHPQPPPVPAWRKIKHVEVVVLVFVAFIVASVVAAAGLLIHRDTLQTEKWLSDWARLEGEGEGGAPNGAAAGAASGADGDGWGRLASYDRLQGAHHHRTASGHHFRTASGGLVSLPSTMVLTWDSIQYTIYRATGHRRRVLKGVFGIAGQTRHAPGQTGLSMCAILGPSGAGKTTLLDILAGRRQGLGLTGEIRVNGVPVTPDAVKGISGYVMQDDVLPGTLTVWEYLMFVASLRLPPQEYGEEERRGRIASILQQLALTKVTNSTIGDAFVRGLSGGERRRLGIAAELLTRPAVLFLDEPTTGLDCTNAARVVDVLADLAAGGGVNVLLSIHQPRPDIFRLMERVVLLSSFGQVVYSGPVTAAEEHFAALGYRPAEATINIADYMLDTIIRSSNEEVDRMVDEFRHSRIAVDDEALSLALARAADPSTLPAPKYSAPYATQLRALATRLLRNTYRHPFLIMLNFAATLFTAVSLALIFHGTGVDTGGIQNRFGVLFFMLLYLSLMSLSSLPIWREEKLLFIRERDAGLYGTAAYYAAVVVFDLIPLRVIPPTFFALISYPIIGLHPNCGTCILWFIALLVLSNVAAATMCMAIGAAAPSNSAANLVGSLLIMMFLLFGGFLLNKDSVPEYCRWISSASYFNYAYEALAVNEFHKAPMDFNFTSPIPTADIPPIRISGDGVLREFGFHHELFYLDVFMLCFIGGCTCALTYAFLLVTGHSMWDVLKTLLSKATASATRRILLLLHRIPHLQPLLPHPPPPPTPGPTPFSPHRPARLPSASSSTRGSTPTSSLPRVSSATFAPAEDYVTISEEAMEEVDCLDAAGGCLGVGLLGGRAAGGDINQPLLLDMDGDNDREEAREVDPVVLSWENVCFRVPLPRGRSRLILRSITGVAGPAPTDGTASPGRRGCLFAVLGPSGAGKTTLIDILSGRNHGSGVSGEIRANGHLVSSRIRRKMSGYVLQDDVLPGTSTVLEYLTFHARLRLPGHYTKEQLQRRVHRIVAELSLGKVAHSYIGDAFVRGLSGGERRRVGIASELLTRPTVLFLDEPTTGLDSTNAARVVDVLADLAAGGGVNVLLSIHQPRPDIFRLMDRILILSGNGQVVYTGPTQAAHEHFASLGLPSPPPNVNIADHLLDLVIKSPPAVVQGLAQRFQGSGAARADEQWMADLQLGDAYHSLQRGRVLLQLSKYEAGYWRQLEVLSGRLAKNMLRHPLLIMLNFVATAVMAAGIGMVYWEAGHDTGGIQDRMGSLFFMLLYLSLMSLSSLPIWADDRLLFVRERAAGAYGTPAYFTAVVLFDLLPMRLLPPVFFAVLSYPMIALRPGWQYAVANLVVLVLGNMTAAALSMALGAASSGVSMANMTGSLAVLSTTLFGGFLLSRNRMPRVLSWAASLSYVRYAYEALVANEFHGATGFKFTGYHQPGTPEEHVPFVAVTGDTVLALFGFRPTAYAADVSMLLVFLAVYLAATFLLLKYKGRP